MGDAQEIWIEEIVLSGESLTHLGLQSRLEGNSWKFECLVPETGPQPYSYKGFFKTKSYQLYIRTGSKLSKDSGTMQASRRCSFLNGCFLSVCLYCSLLFL